MAEQDTKLQYSARNVSAAIAKENFEELVKFTAGRIKGNSSDNAELVATALVSEITSEVAAETAAEIVAETSVIAGVKSE